MFLDDDLDPKTKKAKLRPLDLLSVAELKGYIGDLEAEIKRVEAEIARKEKQKSLADSVFKKQ